MLFLEYVVNFYEMNYSGILVGLGTFLIIGLFHPIVIKSEYYFGVKCWWVFFVVGIAFFDNIAIHFQRCAINVVRSSFFLLFLVYFRIICTT